MTGHLPPGPWTLSRSESLATGSPVWHIRDRAGALVVELPAQGLTPLQWQTSAWRRQRHADLAALAELLARVPAMLAALTEIATATCDHGSPLCPRDRARLGLKGQHP